MEKIKQFQDGLFAIYAILDGMYRLQEGLPTRTSIKDVKSSITSIGLDADKLLFHSNPYVALQDICKQVADIELNEDELIKYTEEV